MFANANVLFPTDFSPFAQYALPYAVAIAKQYGGTLHLVHVLDSSVLSLGAGHGMWAAKSDLDNLLESMQEHAESRLANLEERAQTVGVATQSHIVKGMPAAEIIRLAEELTCGLVVIPTHGRSGFDRIVYGSVCEKVVRQCPVPVLSIKHPEHEFVEEESLNMRLQRILFPTDFSEFSERALPYAVSMCREFAAALTLLHVTEIPLMVPEFLPETAIRLENGAETTAYETLERMKAPLDDITVNVEVRRGLAHREICQAVADADVDLVVIPTHGRSGIAHVFFGSVAEKVVRLARCPVLTIRPQSSGNP